MYVQLEKSIKFSNYHYVLIIQHKETQICFRI